MCGCVSVYVCSWLCVRVCVQMPHRRPHHSATLKRQNFSMNSQSFHVFFVATLSRQAEVWTGRLGLERVALIG